MQMASRSLFRLIRSSPSSVSSIFNLGIIKYQQTCLQRCSISSTCKLFTFKVPFYFDKGDKEETDESPDEKEDRYVRQWLSEKEFQYQTIEDFKSFLTSDEDVTKMNWILNEYEIAKYDTSLCPSFLPPERAKEMLENFPDQTKLINYFHYLYSRENRKNAEKLRRSDNRKETAINLRRAHDNNVKLEMGIQYDSKTGKPAYGKWRNACFIDLGRKEEYTVYIPQNIVSSLFGQKLVIDFSYEDCMSIQEKKSLIKQLNFSFQAIREDEEPFDFWFCNLDDQSKTYSLLEKSLGWDHQAKFSSHFIHRTSKSYIDLFPRDKLIYLCPDSSYDFTNYDDEAVYVVGGLVDRRVVKPVSLAKCKKEKLKHMRLPLDQHLSMIGSKILTIDQVISILIGLKSGKSMEESLKLSVPERKLKKPEQIELEKARRLLKLTVQKHSRKNLYY
ncbi:tRNA methyltransferase 10 homolog C-like [Panonychus citri]|uniref:tRNA methyltransferase 10 homolog C-like n=1 Tax=Panonychus citri TaxID=50023 RepID=UPI0023080332|nr:tRNA methyltransferase 10 homolog C-like [Panonychus citri]